MTVLATLIGFAAGTAFASDPNPRRNLAPLMVAVVFAVILEVMK